MPRPRHKTDEPRLIRLLNILPGQKSDPIGGQQPSVNIQCDLQPLHITGNLNAAITALRLEDKSLLLWADAICIDQSSVEEKNCQVPLIRLIYQQAAVVQIWLGDDTPDNAGQEAFHLLQELSHSFDRLAWNFNMFVRQSEGQSLNSCRLPAFSDPSWTSLFRLVRRPWFTRVCFAEGAYPALDLVSLLQSHRFAGATDHRVKVYALLGLMKEFESKTYGLSPDCLLTTAQVYIEVAKAIISKSPTLDILGVPRRALSPLRHQLPSWAADWDVGHLASSFSFKNLQGDHMFDFDVAKTQATPKYVAFQERVLILHGHVFDTIIQVGELMDPFKSDTLGNNINNDMELTRIRPGVLSGMLHVYSVLHDWRTIYKRSFSFSFRTYPGTSESSFHVFCRIIYLDNMPSNYTLASVFRDYGRFAMRVAFCVGSSLNIYPAIPGFFDWYELRVTMYAMMRAPRGRMSQNTNSIPQILSRTMGRRMIITKKGYLGLAPDAAEVGQSIAIVKGGKVPLLLKPREVNAS
ncbi:MAG: hypothetical protein Q9197_005188 [Variospora fuerteventurae]